MKTDYTEMFNYVKERLAGRDVEATYIDRFPFRRRSNHTWRVFKWAERLVQQENLPAELDHEAVLVAAIFHDVGYAIKPEMRTHDEHAVYSVQVFDEYAADHPFPPEQTERFAWLIRHHSDKQRMKEPDIPLDLLLVMEADIMDETGALGMVWDCLYVGTKADPSYEKALEHLQQYSGAFLLDNPMVTPLARRIWEKKQNLIHEFLDQLAEDLWLGDPG